MPAMTEAFRGIHREVWEEYQAKLDVLANEYRAAQKPMLDQRTAELNAEADRYRLVCQEIYRKYDATIKPLVEPIDSKIDAVIAEREVAIKTLKAKHGVA